MLSAKEVRQFIERLSFLPVAGEYQQDPATISRMQTEAARAFMLCGSVDAAARLCQRLVETCQYFPTPSAIAELQNAPTYEERPRWSCSICNGTGFAPAFGVPCGKGKASRLNIENIREKFGEDGYYSAHGRLIPKSNSEIARMWAVANRRAVVEVSEPCLCRGPVAVAA